ncbi:MAG: alpha/beta hydrolase [Saprospiraceae bacterium]|nr:alpha/beta hydrolase [Saprospiraceae bacterium]
MREKHIPIEFQGRYYTLDGTGNDEKDEIWFILHGQGQLAKYFLNKFKPISRKLSKIIAPEGLAKYYLEGFYGRVGATWMTKEDRLTDISNYLEFLNAVYKKEIPDPKKYKITLLGFSQGAATASRWVLSDECRFDRLVLWAGLFPPDLDFDKGEQKLKDLEVLNIYGTQDPYLNDDRINEQFNIAKRLGVDLKTITFNGGHEIDGVTLQGLD